MARATLPDDLRFQLRHGPVALALARAVAVREELEAIANRLAFEAPNDPLHPVLTHLLRWWAEHIETLHEQLEAAPEWTPIGLRPLCEGEP